MSNTKKSFKSPKSLIAAIVVGIIIAIFVAMNPNSKISQTILSKVGIKTQSTATKYKSKNAKEEIAKTMSSAAKVSTLSKSQLPSYDGKPYVVVNSNKPEFKKEDLTKSSWEKYSELDSLGRVGIADANVGKDLMPTEKRGEISSVKPSGWHSIKYDNVDGKSLYNRCHLIGYQLSGENANNKNLMTGTRYLNVDGMLPFEDEIADYVKSTGNHVRYRVTPIFVGNELVARGVEMEGESVEDNGAGVEFNIYAFNAQPGIKIDFVTGDSSLSKK